MRRYALVIAGYDPTGGAGILADMKALSLSGARGHFIITCLTSQTPDRVISIEPLNVEKLCHQIEEALDRYEPKYCKLGMIYSRELLRCISALLEDREIKLIADPVFKASDGTQLCEDGYIDVYRRKIVPITYLLTPNMYELYQLTGIKDIRQAARNIIDMGAENVLVKGGDAEGKESTDVLFDGKKFYNFTLPRIDGKFHGTGCTFSSLIVANLSRGRGLKTSIAEAKRILWSMMLNSYKLENFESRLLGMPEEVDIPPKNTAGERFDVWLSLNRGVKRFVKIIPDHLIPEVGINFGYALSDAEGRDDVCALVKRIDRSRQLGRLDFASSTHISRVILTAMKFDKKIRSAVNLRYSENFISHSEKLNFTVANFDRGEEPENVSTMEWGTRVAIEKTGGIPDIIYDRGGIGKEAMIRILGRDPDDVVRKVEAVLRSMSL
ncbi:MAG: hypothetical protein FE042_01350 [Thermoplasmata archaeon]|nr:MAG: hypothetical protein FE042_01350 [Thermoplasmata archaeon]